MTIFCSFRRFTEDEMFPVSIARMAKMDTAYQAFLSWRFPYYALPNLAI
jgi:hypothetical protein